MNFRTAIVIISDRGSTDPTYDKTTSLLRSNLQSPYSITHESIIPDEFDIIQSTVASLTSSHDLILTSGGTGFSPRDTTPEAITPLLHRQAPGIVHAMLSSSLQITKMSMASRPVAGTIDRCLVITLPGSPKGAAENLNAVLPALRHIIQLAQGKETQHNPSNEITSGCLCNAPSAVTRSRESPYKTISITDAHSILSSFTYTRLVNIKLTQLQTFDVLAESVYSNVNIPPHPTSILDGYAMLEQGPGDYFVDSTITAGQIPTDIPSSKSVVRVSTGSLLPNNTFGIVMVEDTEIVTIKDEKEIRIRIQTKPTPKHIRLTGSDLAKGELILERGSLITPLGGELATLLAAEISEIKVYKKPTVGIASTGNELVNGHVTDTNRPALLNILTHYNFPVIDIGILPDNVHSIETALNTECDVIITTGGVSMGEHDFVKPILSQIGTIHFGRVWMKPGKPMTFATLNQLVILSGKEKLVCALPGNPASAMTCFHVFVLPMLWKMSGKSETKKVEVMLGEDAELDERPEFVRANVTIEEGKCVALRVGGQRSSRVKSWCGANGLLELPGRGEVENGRIAKGTKVSCLMFQ